MLCDQDNDHMCNVVTFVLIASNTHHNQIYYSFRWIELSYQLPLEGFSHKTEICLLLTPGLTWLEYNVQSSGKTSNTCKQQKFYLISFKKTLQLYRFYCFMHLWFFLSIKTAAINQERQLKTNYWEKCKFLVNVWFGVNWIMKPEINYWHDRVW